MQLLLPERQGNEAVCGKEEGSMTEKLAAAHIAGRWAPRGYPDGPSRGEVYQPGPSPVRDCPMGSLHCCRGVFMCAEMFLIATRNAGVGGKVPSAVRWVS